MIDNLRGYYTWGGGDAIPAPAQQRAKLRYKRFTMRELWPQAGATGFDFAPLLTEFDRARANGQRYALRLRSMTGEGNTGLPEWFIKLPGLTRQSTMLDSGKPVTIPDLSKAEALRLFGEFIHAAAAWIAKHRPGELAIVDIGMLGRWGEGHFWGIKGDGTTDGTRYWMPLVAPVEAKKKLVDFHVAAFGPIAQLCSMTGQKDMLAYAFAHPGLKDRPCGWRRDSLGNDSFDDIENDTAYATLLRERAKIAPVITEFWEIAPTFSAALAREQAKKWSVWLVGNGNLGKAWNDYTAAEQAALLGIGTDLVASVPQPTPEPLPTLTPVLEQRIAVLEQRIAVLEQQTRDDAATMAAMLQRFDELTGRVGGLERWRTAIRDVD